MRKNTIVGLNAYRGSASCADIQNLTTETGMKPWSCRFITSAACTALVCAVSIAAAQSDRSSLRVEDGRETSAPFGALRAWSGHVSLAGLPRELPSGVNSDAAFDLGQAGSFAVVVDLVREGPTGGMTWYGRVEDGSGARLVLSQVEDAVSGAIWHPTLGTIEIRPTPDRDAAGRRRSLVLALDPETHFECGAGICLDRAVAPLEGDVAPVDLPHIPNPPAPRPGGGLSPRSAGECGGCADDGTQIDVMIVYTPVARNAAGGTAAIQAVAMSAVASMNTALMNSGIADTALNLVHLHETTYMETDTDGEDFRSGLRSQTDGRMDEIHALRDQYAADLVALLVHDAPGFAGAAYLSPGNPDWGFSVTEWNAAVGPLIFAHEVGHNFGCQHDTAAYDSYPDFYYAYAHKFTPPGSTLRRTIMAYSPGAVIPHFSNPDVTFMGMATGQPIAHSSPRHNAQVIRESSRSVANFRRRPGAIADCNGNGADDAQDISDGVSLDLNDNGIPDECETRLYVNANAPAGGDGLSWATAYNRLSDALSAPRLLCDYATEVWVARGTYTPTGPRGDRTDRFFVSPRMSLLGGFAGHETSADQRDPAANPTVLSGDRARNDAPGFANRADNSYIVVRSLGAGSRVDGFIIRGGHGNLLRADNRPIAYYGAAMNGSWTGGTIANCIVTDNSNSAGTVFFSGRSMIANCLIAGNRAAPITGFTTPVGAGAVFYEGAEATVVNSTFVSNNATTGLAGALGVAFDSRVDLRNTIMWGNTAALGPSIGHLQFAGSIRSKLMIDHSLVEGGQGQIFTDGLQTLQWMASNLTTDPRFANPAGGNYRLLSASPAINAGDSGAIPPWITSDLGGGARVLGGEIDLGAYESCLSDFNEDGGIDGADVSEFFDAWEEGDFRADMNGDGGIDGADVETFFLVWENGAC